MARNTLIPQTDDVSITTCTVTIKALQVGKKQMTLSVFKQLEHFRLVDTDELELRGTPWGYVNHHWGNQDPFHKHFVVMDGLQLKRSLFWVRPSHMLMKNWEDAPSDIHEWSYSGQKLVKALVHAKAIDGWKTDGPNTTVFRQKLPGTPFSFEEDIPSNWRHLWYGRWPEHEGFGESRQRYHEQTIEASKKAIKESTGGHLTVQQIETKLKVFLQEVQAYCNRWDALMEQLRSVEQLFIAV